MTSTLNSSRHFLASKILPLLILLLCLPGFASARNPPKEPQNLNLQEMVSSSIQLNKKTIQANSLQDEIFPLLVSSKINKLSQSSFPPRKPVDLVCIFGVDALSRYSFNQEIKRIRHLLEHLMPLMIDQDRLAVVLFYNPYYINSNEIIDTLPITKIPSLTNTTPQNWKTILLNIDEKVVKQGLSTQTALKAAMRILDQRNETNRTTGVFISIDEMGKRMDPRFREAPVVNGLEYIEQFKNDLGLQEKNWVIHTFEGQPKEIGQEFVESFVALRAGVIETKFLLKPEESELLNVEIQCPYFLLPEVEKWYPYQGVFSLRNPGLKSGFKEFFFDLKIPKITPDLPSSPIEVKVASYQVVFVLADGSQVAHNQDLTVKIVKEGEIIVEEEEEESKEAMRSFYRKWTKDWSLPTAIYAQSKELLKRYQESLYDSIVKDDEMLQKMFQNMWKEAEKRIDDLIEFYDDDDYDYDVICDDPWA